MELIETTRRAYVIQVNTGNGWRKVRGEGPFTDFRHYEDGREIVHEGSGRRAAERAAASRSNPVLRRPSCSEGYPHRVMEVSA